MSGATDARLRPQCNRPISAAGDRRGGALNIGTSSSIIIEADRAAFEQCVPRVCARRAHDAVRSVAQLRCQRSIGEKLKFRSCEIVLARFQQKVGYDKPERRFISEVSVVGHREEEFEPA